jgi:hypothetical protein
MRGGIKIAQQLPLPRIPDARPDRANIDYGQQEQQGAGARRSALCPANVAIVR